MIDSQNRPARRPIFGPALLAATTLLMTGCAPQVIEVRSAATDCAWAQGLYLSEDSIAALRERQEVLIGAGQTDRAFNVRADRKAIGDHNALFERNCTEAGR